jgi:hypothetical protein
VAKKNRKPIEAQLDEHDPDKCLGCRIGKLLEELYGSGVSPDKITDDILPVVARMVGTLMLACSELDLLMFTAAVRANRDALARRKMGAMSEEMRESMHETKH